MTLRPLAFAALLALGPAAHADLSVGKRAPDFEQRALSGGTVRLSSYTGKVVLLDFWASWCEPCKKELPLLSKLAAKLKSRGIEVIAVNIDDHPEAARAFLRDHGVQLTVVGDQDKKIVSVWEPPTMPSSYVIDKTGIVRHLNRGFDPGDEAKFEKQLLALAGD
jgi:peroxiredoxin